ncbi:MAG: SMC-Scp complex subunit ScpB [Ruminococcus sp.]|nr:SMC-Scp complex subunit ScpB [Ruminococcus sp.]
MEIKEKLGAIEAVIFAGGEAVESSRIAHACGIDVGSIPMMIDLLNERYDDCGSGICIKNLDGCYQMCTREKFAPQIREALETKKNIPLSNAALEVLTIIAYNQPISKGFVENVRGIDSSSVINNLVEKALIEESGRLDVPGKPVIYRTTANFLRCFGLTSISELPPLADYQPSRQLEFELDNADTDENA